MSCREPLQSAQTALKMTSEIAAEQVLPWLQHFVLLVVLDHHICGQLFFSTTHDGLHILALSQACELAIQS